MSSALRRVKLSMLGLSSSIGLFRLLRNSRWRASQLLILCYHGISMDDEHQWAPGLYMSPETLAARLDQLRRSECTVLPLDEAVHRLYDGTLPPRSVALTFDDGNFDFYGRAWPLLRERGQTATVYLTTYYSDVNVPVFPLVVSYMLWKRRGTVRRIRLSYSDEVQLDTRSESGRRHAHNRILLHAQDEGMSALEKDQLAERLADVLDIDYAELKRRRLLHLMNAAEVREIAAGGIDVQLHTHRHRSPPDRKLYRDEIAQNRQRVETLTGTAARHFCYPSGVWSPAFARWLDEAGILSATTCEPGIASPRSHRLRLPRLLDHSELTPIEFDAWLAGVGALLPRRPLGSQSVDEKGRPKIGTFEDAPTPAHTMEI